MALKGSARHTALNRSQSASLLECFQAQYCYKRMLILFTRWKNIGGTNWCKIWKKDMNESGIIQEDQEEGYHGNCMQINSFRVTSDSNWLHCNLFQVVKSYANIMLLSLQYRVFCMALSVLTLKYSKFQGGENFCTALSHHMFCLISILLM